METYGTDFLTPSFVIYKSEHYHHLQKQHHTGIPETLETTDPEYAGMDVLKCKHHKNIYMKAYISLLSCIHIRSYMYTYLRVCLFT
jgi:hypothetical protein